MKGKIIFISILNLMLSVLVAGSGAVYGYEVHTHARMTDAAYERVLQADGQLIDRLGLTLMQNNLGEIYYDASDANIYERKADKFSTDDQRMPNIADAFKVKGWLMRGAIREDDLGEVLGINKGADPHDDPYGPFWRVNSHFYDPDLDRSLTLSAGCISTFESLTGESVSTIRKNPAWALGTGDADAFSNPNTPDSTRRNHYSIKDAREYMYRAVTGQDKDGSKAIVPDGSGGAREPNDNAEAEDARKAYWATTFRALGDIVHLIEDVGQPQHTRNDAHGGVPTGVCVGEGSDFEHYINARALGSKTVRVDGRTLIPRPLNYDGYSIPTFSNYSSYWSTREGVASGRGLADYSNRGFFTAGKNLGQNEYASPSNNSASYTAEAVSVADKYIFNPLAEVNFLRGDVPDTLNAAQDNIRMTTESAWDYFLGTAKTYSLNHYNYDDMADLLIPRAVAYSAGMINHFFRGKFEVLPPNEGIYGLVDHATPHTVLNGEPIRSDNGEVFGYTKIRLKLRNTTADINDGGAIPQDMVGGTLVAVARFRTNPCYQPDLSGEFDSSGATPNGCGTADMLNSPEQVVLSVPYNDFTLNSNVQVDLEFDFKANPIPVNATNLFLDIVYRGPLGSETDAVVVTSVDLYEPTYITYANNSDYVRVYGDLYTKADIEADTAIQLLIDQSPEGDNDGGTTDLPDPPTFLEPIDPVNVTTISYYFNGGAAPDATVSLLVPKRYNRFVVLTDSSPVNVYIDTSTEVFNGALTPVTSQLDESGLTYGISPFWLVRGYRAWRLHSYHVFYGAPSVTDLSVMSKVTNAELDPVISTLSTVWQ